MGTEGPLGARLEGPGVTVEWTFILYSVGATKGFEVGDDGIRAGVLEPFRGSGHSLLDAGLQLPLYVGHGRLHCWTCYCTSFPWQPGDRQVDWDG